MISAAVRDRAADLHAQFESAQPFRHVVIDEFLDPEFCARLIAEFPTFNAASAINERGEPGRKAVISQLASIGPAYAAFDRLMRDPEFLALTGRITGIPDLLYDPDYVGGGTHENLDGQDLDRHVDFNFHPTRAVDRRLNLIVFLNPEWDESWGGCLELTRDPWSSAADARRTVLPVANRAVIFETTESSWHGFERIRLPASKPISRRSIAVYFYTKGRPAHESAPSHGTIYYQRPLPQQIQPGHTLTEEDAAEIQQLLARRDQQIKFLYDREKKFSHLIANLANSPSFRIGRILTWPARTFRSLLKPQ